MRKDEPNEFQDHKDSISSDAPDGEFNTVLRWLSDPARLRCAASAIRLAIDWVIDGARTQRYRIEQLKASEKVYIGNRVEHEILHQWDLVKEPPLDTKILDVPVDIKFSLRTSWMIPPEALDKLCIIVTANDDTSTFSIGLFRAKPEHLRRPNRDRKFGIKKTGRSAISWVARDAALPENFLLHLPEAARTKILSHRTGRARVTEMFRLVLNKPIPTTAIDTLAVQRDPSKRIRKNGGAKDVLGPEGIEILGWRYDKSRIKALGLPPLEDDFWISVRKI
jgi:hypothetical protein